MAVPALQQKAGTIRALFEKDTVRKQIALAIPKHLSVDRLLRVAITAIRTNPKLMDCTQESLLACVMGCAQLGLEPEPFLGQAYMVPFFNSKKKAMEAQLIPGYRGYLALARRSGEVKSVTSQVVYENDHFKLQYGLNESLEHEPAEGNRGEVRGAYVIFRYKDGSHSFDYMSKADIEKVRARSKSAESGPWMTDWDEMAKKTVIKRHIKVVPLSVELTTAAAIEDKFNAGESQMGIFTDTEDAEFEEVPPSPEMFEEFLDSRGFADKAEQEAFDKFLIACAKHNKATVNEVKVKASTPEAFAELWTTFEKWQKKQVKASQPPATAPEISTPASEQGNGESPVRGITEDQAAYLRAVPEEFISKIFVSMAVPYIPISELDFETADKMIAEAKKIN